MKPNLASALSISMAVISFVPRAVHADEAVAAVVDDGPPTVGAAVAAPLPSPPRPPPPYSLPFQLRPVAPGSVVRSDTTLAAYEMPDGSGTTVASTFLAAYKVSPTMAPLFRFAAVNDNPATGSGATTMSNPLFGLLYGKPLAPAVKLGLFGAITLPVGSGGGDTPDAVAVATNRAGLVARSSMDNALFAVNDWALIGGADLAYVKGGLTVQAEFTVFQLTRVRGDEVQPDSHKTNFTSGLHAGYFATPWLSLGAELRYQRWLSTPKAVANDATGATRDNLTAAAGVRGHIKLSGKRWLRPGIAYTRPLDDPMSGRGYDIIQVDVPYAF
jgi:hypothetical protein